MFKKENKEDISLDYLRSVVLYAPASGNAVSLKDVPDPIFSGKMMGDGLAIDPAEGYVYAPADGEILHVFPTKHAIGFKAANGVEMLIHIGLETVALKGEGFKLFVQNGDLVKKGDKLVGFDLSIIKQKAASTLIPIVITNTDKTVSIDKTTETLLIKGETPFLTITMK